VERHKNSILEVTDEATDPGIGDEVVENIQIPDEAVENIRNPDEAVENIRTLAVENNFTDFIKGKLLGEV
jgi:hypothetical protein